MKNMHENFSASRDEEAQERAFMSEFRFEIINSIVQYIKSKGSLAIC